MKAKMIINRAKFNQILNDCYKRSGLYVLGTALEAFFFEIKIHYIGSPTQKSLSPSTEKAILDYASHCAAELRGYYHIEDEDEED